MGRQQLMARMGAGTGGALEPQHGRRTSVSLGPGVVQMGDVR